MEKIISIEEYKKNKKEKNETIYTFDEEQNELEFI